MTTTTANIRHQGPNLTNRVLVTPHGAEDNAPHKTKVDIEEKSCCHTGIKIQLISVNVPFNKQGRCCIAATR